MLTRETVRYYLAWRSLPRVGDAALRKLLSAGRDLPALWNLDQDELHSLISLPAPALQPWTTQRHAVLEQAEATTGRVFLTGAELLLWNREGWPAQLPTGRWPALFTLGAHSLLQLPLVALVSSRDASPENVARTDALADQLARRDVALVTSAFRPGYQATAVAAKRQAAPTVLVLDRGLGDLARLGVPLDPVPGARVWDPGLDPDLQLLISPFPWYSGWSSRFGRERDALLMELARLVVAVDVNSEGGMLPLLSARAAAGKPTVFLQDDRPRCEPPDDARVIPWTSAETVAQELALLLGTDHLEDQTESRRMQTRLLGAFASALLPSRRSALQIRPGNAVAGELIPGWRRDNSTDAASQLLVDARGRKLPGIPESLAPEGATAILLTLDPQDRGRLPSWLLGLTPEVVIHLPVTSLHPSAAVGPSEALVLLRRSKSGVAPPAPRVFHPSRSPSTPHQFQRYLREVLDRIRPSGSAGF